MVRIHRAAPGQELESSASPKDDRYHDATIPLVIARDPNASGNTRILLSTPQAIALGIACGAALAATGVVIRRWWDLRA